jgi:hypothetical protein
VLRFECREMHQQHLNTSLREAQWRVSDGSSWALQRWAREVGILTTEVHKLQRRTDAPRRVVNFFLWELNGLLTDMSWLYCVVNIYN